MRNLWSGTNQVLEVPTVFTQCCTAAESSTHKIFSYLYSEYKLMRNTSSQGASTSPQYGCKRSQTHQLYHVGSNHSERNSTGMEATVNCIINTVVFRGLYSASPPSLPLSLSLIAQGWPESYDQFLTEPCVNELMSIHSFLISFSADPFSISYSASLYLYFSLIVWLSLF